MKKILLFIIVFVLIIGFSLYDRVKYYTKEANKAKIFCESLIPRLEKYKQKYGFYPSKIDTNWYQDQKISKLIRIENFFIIINSNHYYFRYKNPIIFQDNVFGYDSEQKMWLQYDGY